MEILTASCFCRQPGVSPDSGNPAAIVVDFNGADEEKLGLAKRLDLPVTVFINDIDNEMPFLQFYYPSAKMPMCLHGSLVVARYLFGVLNRLSVKCVLEGGINLEMAVTESDLVEVRVGQKGSIEMFSDHELVRDFLNQKKVDFISNEMPMCLSSVGSLKLLIPLRSPELLTRAHPSFDKIKQWSESCGVNGIYAYSQLGTSTFVARGFNPKGGHNEDAATGVAAAALSLALEKSIEVRQGDNLGRPSTIHARYVSQEEIYVGGYVSDFRSVKLE